MITTRSYLYFLWHLCWWWAGVSYIQVTIHWNRTVLSHFCCTYPSKLSIDKQSALPRKHEHCFLHSYGPGQMTSWSLVMLQELIQVNGFSALLLWPSHKHTLHLWGNLPVPGLESNQCKQVWRLLHRQTWYSGSIPLFLSIHGDRGSLQSWINSLSKLLPLHSYKGPQCPVQHEIVLQQHLIFRPEVKGFIYADARKRKSPTSLRTESWCSNISDLAVLA